MIRLTNVQAFYGSYVMSVIKVRTSLWAMCDKCNKGMGVIMSHVV